MANSLYAANLAVSPPRKPSRSSVTPVRLNVRRVFYACGPGNAIEAHANWKSGKAHPSEFSVTYSSLVEDLCDEIGAEAFLVSHNPNARVVTDGNFTVEHRPKKGSDSSRYTYFLRECRYAASLVATAVKSRADVAIVSSGTTFPFCLWMFRLAGIPVVTVLHNSLWPKDHRPTGKLQRAIHWLDGTFFRWGASGVVGVSPECIRQVVELTGRERPNLHVMKPVYDQTRFTPPPPRPHGDGPFRIVFFGRITRNKGVFDILEIAERVDRILPGRVRWEIWGDGPDLAELTAEHARRNLGEVVSVCGWASPQEQKAIYARAHASIVPSRSDFAEGLAKTAVESVLAGRPVITNPVVPALEVLRPACVAAKTNDMQSYVDAVTRLEADAGLYADLQAACSSLAEEFYTPEGGLGAKLKAVLHSAFGERGGARHGVEVPVPARSTALSRP